LVGEIVVAFTTGQRRALEMLAGSPNGYTETTLRAHGFKVGLLPGLVRHGLAKASRDSVKAGGQMMNVVRFKITDAGRRALAE
jgi:hypothetical protein